MLLLGATKCPGKKVGEDKDERVKGKEVEVAAEEGKKKRKEKEPSTPICLQIVVVNGM